VITRAVPGEIYRNQPVITRAVPGEIYRNQPVITCAVPGEIYRNLLNQKPAVPGEIYRNPLVTTSMRKHSNISWSCCLSKVNLDWLHDYVYYIITDRGEL
jgi:hypothetical protein